jgi:hypothetical protein
MLARRVTSECITTFRLAPHVLSSRERGAGGSDPVLPIRQELRFDFTVTPGMGGGHSEYPSLYASAGRKQAT